MIFFQLKFIYVVDILVRPRDIDFETIRKDIRNSAFARSLLCLRVQIAETILKFSNIGRPGRLIICLNEHRKPHNATWVVRILDRVPEQRSRQSWTLIFRFLPRPESTNPGHETRDFTRTW